MSSEERNIVLIVLDSVRQDVFSEFAPRLQRRADASYTQCRAASGWSVPSHASMFTGLRPEEHDIHFHNSDFTAVPRSGTFLGELPDHRAVGVSSNTYTSVHGFDEWFDEYRYACPMYRLPKGIHGPDFTTPESGLGRHFEFFRAAVTHDHPLASLANGLTRLSYQVTEEMSIPRVFDDGATAIERTASRLVNEEPYFLFTNFMEAHWPLTPFQGLDHSMHDVPADWSSENHFIGGARLDEDATGSEQLERYHDLYESAVDYLDRRVSAFVDDLQASSPRETTVVVTADHGDNLGTAPDDRLLGHKSSLTEGLLHVPMVVINPPDSSHPDIVSEPVSHLALPELLVGLAEGSVPDITDRPALAERVGSNDPTNMSEMEKGADWWNRQIRAVYSDGRKYQWDSLGNCTGYRLDESRPNWQAPADEEPDCEALDEEWFDVPIREFKRRATEAAAERTLDPATESRLAQLGYR